MNFTNGQLYHIYNQGNNRRMLFYNRSNYLYFFEKIVLYVKPYADVFAYCLMPNHFHLMILVNSVVDTVSINGVRKKRNLNDSIGIMLRSYTRALNKEFGFSGKLFREGTKAICLNNSEIIDKAYFFNNGVTKISYELPKNQYPQVCYNYIHQNPVKAGLVKNAIDWEFSSVREYLGMEQNGLININKAEKYLYLTPSVLTVSL